MQESFPPQLDAWYLVGPTAAGKTAVGVELARLLQAEIISMDSMAVYKGMDIGTAKPSVSDRHEIPHHLLDVVEPDVEFSIAEYLAGVGRTANEIQARGREILFVGGTSLYLKALLRGMSSGPPADWDVRARLEQDAAREGPQFLHRRLAEVDPEAAKRLHPQDQRRLIRALEVYEQTRLPISSFQSQFGEAPAIQSERVFVIDWPREVLHQRINDRVRKMFEAGLVDEVEGLLSKYGRLSRTAGQAAGYREVIEFLQGECDLAQAAQSTQARTRQLARRQLTWFRSLQECRWIAASEDLDFEALVRVIADHAGL